MMNNDDQITILQSHFDSIVRTDSEASVEFWYARDLQPYLGVLFFDYIILTTWRFA